MSQPTTDESLTLSVVRRWLADAAQWEAEREHMRGEIAELRARALAAEADANPSTSRSALKRKAAEYREERDRERRVSDGLRAEREALRRRLADAEGPCPHARSVTSPPAQPPCRSCPLAGTHG